MDKHPLNVLVVDDVEEITEGMCRILKRVYRECYTAADGEAALEVCARHHVDVLVTDLIMPRMDGLALIKAVHTRFPHINPVIVITGEATSDVMDEVAQMQVPALTKPVDVSALLDLIEEIASG